MALSAERHCTVGRQYNKLFSVVCATLVKQWLSHSPLPPLSSPPVPSSQMYRWVKGCSVSLLKQYAASSFPLKDNSKPRHPEEKTPEWKPTWFGAKRGGRTDSKTSEDLWRTANQGSSCPIIQRAEWGWIGHIPRKPASDITRQALT